MKIGRIGRRTEKGATHSSSYQRRGRMEGRENIE